jgi:septum formation protein
MPARTLLLASASPARLRLLRDAGFDPKVVVTGVSEDDVDESDARVLVATLARRKALAAAPAAAGAIVIGCDSMLELGGRTLGKPASADEAIARWHAMRGSSGTLMTGHCVVDSRNGRREEGVATTTVRFGTPSDAEVAAYVATGEPLHVAGAFTLDGLAAPFIAGIDGDPSNVIGLSLPLLRDLLTRLGIDMTELWA